MIEVPLYLCAHVGGVILQTLEPRLQLLATTPVSTNSGEFGTYKTVKARFWH